MSAQRKVSPRRRSFKPAFDLLERRDVPSGLSAGYRLPPIGIGPGGDILPGPPSGVVSVSTQYLDVTRGGDPASFTVVLNSQPSAEVDVTLAQYEANVPLPM